MAPNLLEFPAEIIAKILKTLLPPLSGRRTVMGSSLEHDLECRPKPPADLCRLMLVCKAFRSLAFPWVWRRARIRRPDRKPRGVYWEDSSEDGWDDPQPPDQSWPLTLYIDAGAAAHIRVLNITITECYSMDALSKILTSLLPVFLLMDNIRVLKFIYPMYIGFRHDVLDEVYPLLISKPLLHTLITTQGLPPDIYPAPGLRNLRHQHVKNDASWSCPALLPGGTPVLESFVLEGKPQYNLTLLLPWETLREIALIQLGVTPWWPILDDFLLWKETSLTTPKLAELSIDHIIVSRNDVIRLVSGFQSQNITSFRVSRVDTIDGALLDIIADSFPQLKNLGMIDKVYNEFGAWNVNLSTVSMFLRKLPKLETLYWNYVDGWTHPWYEKLTPTKKKFRKILAPSERVLPVWKT